MLTLSRVLVLVGSAALIALGLFLGSSEDLPLLGLVTAAIGVAGVGVVIAERLRYRSDREERIRPYAGSPGGLAQDEPLDPRFRRTDEVFLDPTTGRRMRVHADPNTGERRYRAEDRP
jgi:hypothetical protein